MKKWAYYNEIDPFMAQWIRELIKEKLITDGDVDERSIEDVLPADIKGFQRAHFFGGAGVWDYALRRAGWPDDRRVWTGSCPCQPFSTAGKRKGDADERHLWPAFFHLINQCRPPVLFGEQVEAAIKHNWLDLVQSDLEGIGYAVGAVGTPSAGVGAPHIRARLWFVGELADAKCSTGDIGCELIMQRGWSGNTEQIGVGGCSSLLADATNGGCKQREFGGEATRYGGAAVTESGAVWMEHPLCSRQSRSRGLGGQGDTTPDQHREVGRAVDVGGVSLLAGGLERIERPRETNGIWRDVDWLFCRDGKWRPVESRSEPLADGLADKLGYVRIGDRYSLSPLQHKAENRQMRLKGYGNAINAEAAIAFIQAYLDA